MFWRDWRHVATLNNFARKNHTVLVPDLRGAGNSAKPSDGYDKKTMAQDIHPLVTSLGNEKIT